MFFVVARLRSLGAIGRSASLGFLLGLILPTSESRATPTAGDSFDDYRRAVAAQPGGDPARGRRLFLDAARTRCVACHAINGQGGRLGPDLLGVGGRYSPVEILNAILEPSAQDPPRLRRHHASPPGLGSASSTGLVRPLSDAEVEVATSETADRPACRLDEIEERRGQPRLAHADRPASDDDARRAGRPRRLPPPRRPPDRRRPARGHRRRADPPGPPPRRVRRRSTPPPPASTIPSGSARSRGSPAPSPSPRSRAAGSGGSSPTGPPNPAPSSPTSPATSSPAS